jgi:hypothetical protein
MQRGAGSVCGHSLVRMLSICLGICTTVFQAEMYPILACVYEIQLNVR